jgi:Flp pilus assembly protein TadG
MRDRGSVLLLVPAAVLVLVVLGAIAVDSAVAFLGQREVSNAAAAAANDAATAALSDRLFYSDAGALAIDPVRARVVARRAVAARLSRGVEVVAVDVEVGAGGEQVCVTVRGRVPYVFARGLPFVARQARVTGRAGAMAVAGDAPLALPRASSECS